jgi:hypothetical protein
MMTIAIGKTDKARETKHLPVGQLELEDGIVVAGLCPRDAAVVNEHAGVE